MAESAGLVRSEQDETWKGNEVSDKTKAFKTAMVGGLAVVAISILAIVLIRSGAPDYSPVSQAALTSSLYNDTPLWEKQMDSAIASVAWGNQNLWKIYMALGFAVLGAIAAAAGFVGLRNRRGANEISAPVQQVIAR